MAKSSRVSVESTVGYVKEETRTKFVFRVKLPNGEMVDRVAEKKDLPKRRKGESPLFEITTTMSFRWLKIPPPKPKKRK